MYIIIILSLLFTCILLSLY